MGLFAVMGPSIKDHFGLPLFKATRLLKMSFFSQNSRISCSSFTKSTFGFTFSIMVYQNLGAEITPNHEWIQLIMSVKIHFI